MLQYHPDGGISNFQSGTPTHLAKTAMLSMLGGDLPVSTSLIHDCANPVLSLTARWLSLAALRAWRKLRAKISRSVGTDLLFLTSSVSHRLSIRQRSPLQL